MIYLLFQVMHNWGRFECATTAANGSGGDDDSCTFFTFGPAENMAEHLVRSKASFCNCSSIELFFIFFARSERNILQTLWL
jgi:hypothetical protein